MKIKIQIPYRYFIFAMVLLLQISVGADTYRIEYRYDSLDRLIAVIHPDGQIVKYTYDEVGNRTRKVSTLQADASIDGTVNFKDFALLAQDWLLSEDNLLGDFNIDKKVDSHDLAILSQQWLEDINP